MDTYIYDQNIQMMALLHGLFSNPINIDYIRKFSHNFV